MTTLHDIGEAGAIALMAGAVHRGALPEGWEGIGDDAAVTTLPPGVHVLTTCDVLVEDIHFRRRTTSAEDLGWKALTVNVSDIHAMGGTPAWAVVGVSAPGDLPVDWYKALCRGFGEASDAYFTPIVGGDTVGSAGPLTLSVTVVGHAARPRLQSGAKPGDRVIATGPWGLARAGLWVLENPRSAAALQSDARDAALRHHLRPNLPGVPPEFAQIERMALIDDSDGLTKTCGLIAAASGVAVDLDPAALRAHPAVEELAASAGASVQEWQFLGGEDYGLVAAIPPDVPVPTGWTGIGTVKAGSGVKLGGDPLVVLGAEAFRHF